MHPPGGVLVARLVRALAGWVSLGVGSFSSAATVGQCMAIWFAFTPQLRMRVRGPTFGVESQRGVPHENWL